MCSCMIAERMVVILSSVVCAIDLYTMNGFVPWQLIACAFISAVPKRCFLDSYIIITGLCYSSHISLSSQFKHRNIENGFVQGNYIIITGLSD